MNKENFEKIVADLDDLKNLVEFFSTQEEIPPIEIDIVKRKLQDIYMQFSNSPEIQKKNEVAPEIIEKEPEPVFEVKKEITEDKVKEGVVESNPEPIVEEPEEKAVVKEIPVQSHSSTTLSEKLKDNNQSLNDRLSNKKGNDISSRLQKGPIKDLNAAIGLNDKFSYIKTLFDGDAHKFRDAVETLNSIQTINAAEEFIASNYSWNMEDAITKQFLDLIHRKLQHG